MAALPGSTAGISTWTDARRAVLGHAGRVAAPGMTEMTTAARRRLDLDHALVQMATHDRDAAEALIRTATRPTRDRPSARHPDLTFITGPGFAGRSAVACRFAGETGGCAHYKLVMRGPFPSPGLVLLCWSGT